METPHTPRRATHRVRRATAPVVLALLTAAGAAACGEDSPSPSAAPVSVQAGDASCRVDRTELTAGLNTLRITNTGSKVTEVYVYAADGSIVTERESIGPGTGAEVTFEVTPGDYEIACKPGQKGNGIRQKIRVAASTATATPGLSPDDSQA